MTQAVTQLNPQNPVSLEDVILYGDLAKLTPNQRVEYQAKLCSLMGLNPLTKPFEFMTLSGRLVCYASKNCAEQLRKVHRVSIRITAREKIDDVYVVTAEASMPDGRVDSSTGAVHIGGLKGEALANAMLKAETKSKRRVTLSICSLGMLDETEVESVRAVETRVAPEQPADGDGNPSFDAGYRIPFGKFAKRSLEEVGPEQLGKYVEWLESNAAKTGKPLSDAANDFIARVEQYIGGLESAPIEPGSGG